MFSAVANQLQSVMDGEMVEEMEDDLFYLGEKKPLYKHRVE